MLSPEQQKVADRSQGLVEVGRHPERRKELGFTRREAKKARKLLPVFEQMQREAEQEALEKQKVALAASAFSAGIRRRLWGPKR